MTERAAVAAARLRGRGDEMAADQVAVDAMRQELNRLPIDGTVVIGGGYEGNADLESGKSALDVRGLAKSAETACTIFPVLRSARLLRAWAGIDGEAADRIPVIGRGRRHDGLTHAFGFSGHGFQLAPAVGRALAELIRTGASSLPLEPFSPARFQEKSHE